MEGKNETQKKLEIRTMAKDIARLREKETDNQRDKIVAIKTEVAPQKINDAKNFKSIDQAKLDITTQEQERKQTLLQIITEEKNLQRIKEEERKKVLEETMLKAEMEARRTANLADRIKESAQKIEQERLSNQESLQQKAQEEAVILQQKIENENRRKEEAELIRLRELERNVQEEANKKLMEDKIKQREAEILLLKQNEEILKSEQEAKLKNQREKEKAKLAELLSKVRGPVDRLRERMEQRRAEKAMAEQRPNLEGQFFKKVSEEKKEEPVLEKPVMVEKTPEQIMIEKLQKITEQREKEKQERENFLKRVSDEKIQTAPQWSQEEIPATKFPLMSKTPLKKIPTSEKIWVRILVIGVLVTVWGILITYNYWTNVARKPAPIQTPVVQTPVVQTPVITRSLIPVIGTKVLKFDTAADLKNQLSLSLEEGYLEGEIRRVIFGNNQTKQYLTTQEMFEYLGLNAPPELFQKIDSDFTFFIYSKGPNNKYGKTPYNRFGIIAKIKNRENLSALMTKWEPSMETDLEPLFAIVGKTEPAIVSYFRNWKYPATLGYNFRFQTFTVNDLGICYLNIGDYFILTSSGESIRKMIDILK